MYKPAFKLSFEPCVHLDMAGGIPTSTSNSEMPMAIGGISAAHSLALCHCLTLWHWASQTSICFVPEAFVTPFCTMRSEHPAASLVRILIWSRVKITDIFFQLKTLCDSTKDANSSNDSFQLYYFCNFIVVEN